MDSLIKNRSNRGARECEEVTPTKGIEATRPLERNAASVGSEGIAVLQSELPMEVVEDAGGGA